MSEENKKQSQGTEVSEAGVMAIIGRLTVEKQLQAEQLESAASIIVSLQKKCVELSNQIQALQEKLQVPRPKIQETDSIGE